MTKFMEDAVVRQNAEKSDFEKAAKEVRDLTERDAEEIGANATRITTVAEAQASRIVEVSQAEADRILAEAYGNGWVSAMQGLEITEQADRAEFLRLMGILDNPSSPQLIQTDLSVTINSGRRLEDEELPAPL